MIYDDQNSMKIPRLLIKSICKEVIKLENQKVDEVFLHFVSTQEICRLHQNFFNDPTTTDCISFPIDDETEQSYRVLGEVFICPQTAIDYSFRRQKDPYEELILYVIHGLLHLMGYDDIDEADKKLMRKVEKRHLLHLKKLGFLINKKT